MKLDFEAFINNNLKDCKIIHLHNNIQSPKQIFASICFFYKFVAVFRFDLHLFSTVNISNYHCNNLREKEQKNKEERWF